MQKKSETKCAGLQGHPPPNPHFIHTSCPFSLALCIEFHIKFCFNERLHCFKNVEITEGYMQVYTYNI